MILVSALQVDKAVFFTAAITVTAFLPLFTMQGVEGQIFGPMARTYAYALAGALLATFTVTPVMASLVLPRTVQETSKPRRPRASARSIRRCCASRSPIVGVTIAIGVIFLVPRRRARLASGQRVPAGAGGGQLLDPRLDAADASSLDAGNGAANKMREILRRHPEILTVVSQHGRPDNGSRRLALLQCRTVRAAEALRRMARRADQGKTDRATAEGIRRTSCPASASTSRNTSRTTSRRPCPA